MYEVESQIVINLNMHHLLKIVTKILVVWGGGREMKAIVCLTTLGNVFSKEKCCNR